MSEIVESVVSTNPASLVTAVGRRRTASARVRLSPGTGQFTVNGRELDAYCYTELLSSQARRPLVVTESASQFDIRVLVAGGGPVGQAEAISHGLARALQTWNPEWRVPLKRAGLLRRDPRMKERKKSGQPGARKRFQFSKR